MTKFKEHNYPGAKKKYEYSRSRVVVLWRRLHQPGPVHTGVTPPHKVCACTIFSTRFDVPAAAKSWPCRELTPCMQHTLKIEARGYLRPTPSSLSLQQLPLGRPTGTKRFAHS
jgi:hypothetical protein